MKKMFLFATAAAAMFLLCGCQEKPGTAVQPVIKLDGESVRQLSAEGGEASFGYTVESPAEDGEMHVSAPGADWLGDFVVEDDCRVNYRFEANAAGEERTAEIRLSYVYGGGSVDAALTVTQAAGETGGDEPWTGPHPDLICPDQQIPAEGGEAFAIYYVNYAAEGGVVSLSHDEYDWVSGWELNEQDTRVMFTVEPNPGEKRSFCFTLLYTYGNGLVEEQTVTVTQLANASEGPSVEREMVYAMGTYNGTDRTYTNVHEYHVYMSNQPFDAPDEYASPSASYDVDLYGEAPADSGTMLPPAGTYEYGVTLMNNTFSLYFLDIFGEWHSFSTGTLALDYDESGNMVLDVTATDEKGDVHHVTFSGPVSFEDIRGE